MYRNRTFLTVMTGDPGIHAVGEVVTFTDPSTVALRRRFIGEAEDLGTLMSWAMQAQPGETMEVAMEADDGETYDGAVVVCTGVE